MSSSGAHRRAGRPVLVLLQLLVFLTYIFGPTASLAEEPLPDPSPAPTVAPDPTPAPILAPDPAPAPADPTPTPAPAPGTLPYLISFTTGTDDAAQLLILASAGATDVSSIPQLNIRSILLDQTIYADQLAALRANPGVIRVETDKVRDVGAAPSDTSYADQWSLPKVGWDQLYGTVGIAGSATVAVLDTGVDASHPDLDGVVLPGTSVLGASNGQTDPNGHGTWMAGIVAAETNNAYGIAGTAYAGVSILPVTVLGADGTGQDSDIITGVVYAADAGADVILMSFSNPGYSAALQAAIDYAWARGAVLVAATGNDGVGTATFPAGDRGVIGVASTDASDALAASSNYGPAAFMAAPGVGITTTAATGGVATISGTSAAAASVAGAAALLQANEPFLSNGVIVSRLARTADPAGDPAQTGNGRLNLARAIGDASTDSIQPAGAAPLGDGGPLVGPYVAAANNFNVTPSTQTVAAGSTSTFTWTFSAANAGNQPTTTFTVPVGWTAPQVGAGPGQVTVTAGTCAASLAGVVGMVVTIDQGPGSGTCANNTTFTLTYANATAPTPATTTTYTFDNQHGQDPTVTVTADITAPAAPTITDSDPDSPANDNAPELKGTAEAGSTVRLYTNATCTSAVAASGTASAFASPGLTVTVANDSSTSFYATATDAAGNVSACSASAFTYVEDSTAPAAPTITDSDPDSPANDNAPELKGTAEAGSTVRLYTNATCTSAVAASGTASAFASPGLTVTVANDSSTSFYATATDAAGNVSACSASAFTYVEDSTAPTATIDLQADSDSGSSSTDNLTNASTLVFDVTFSESVSGLAAGDFTNQGTATGCVIAVGAPTGNVYPVTLTSCSEGTVILRLAASGVTDTAGNANAQTDGPTVTIDRSAPAAPSTPDLAASSDTGSSSTDNVTADNTPTFTGTAESGSTVKLYVDGLLEGSDTATGGTYSITTSALADGVHAVKATATDAAGNTSADSGSLSVTIDTAAPAAPSTPDLAASSDTGSSSTDNVTADNTPTFTGTAESGSTVKLYVDGLLEGSDTATGGTYSITTSALADGVHAVKATATDAAGNTSADSGSLSVTIDTAAPAAPSTPDLAASSDTGSSSTDNVTADNTPTFTGTAESGSTVKLYVDGLLEGSDTATGGTYSITTSALADGVHAVKATATDAAGNTSADSGSLSVTIDTAAPTATIDLQADSDSGSSSTDNLTNASTLVFDVTFSESVSGLAAGDFTNQGTATGCVIAVGAPTGNVYPVTLTSCSEGTVILRLAASGVTDTAGNANAQTDGPTVTIDRSAPAAPSTPDLAASSDTGSSSTDNVTADNTPTFTGTAESGSTVKLYVDGLLEGSDTATGGTYSITTSALADGVHAVKATATDAAGNTSADSGSLSVTIDTAAPAAPSTPDLAASSDTGSSSTDNVTADNTPTFTGTAESGSTVKLYVDGLLEGSDTATGGTYSITTSALADGVHAVKATATDAAGNTSADSGSLSVTIDTAAPAAPSTPDLAASSDTGSSSTDNVTADNTPTFTGTAESGSTVKLYVDGLLEGSDTATGGTYSITTSALADGVHAVKATATDAAGNTSADSGSLSVTIDTAAPTATIDLQADSDSGSSSTDNLTNASTLVFDVTFSESVSGLAAGDFTNQGTATGCVIAVGAPTGNVYPVTLTSCSEGTVILRLAASGVTDTAGNANAQTDGPTVTIDRSAPAAPSTPDLAASSDTGSSSTDNVTADNTPTFTGTAESGSTVKLYVDGLLEGSDTATGGTYSITTSALADGVHAVKATATDAAGNTSADSGSLSVTIDTAAPAAPSTPDLAASSDTGSSSTDNVTADNTPTFTGTAESGSTVKLYVDGLLEGSDTATGGTYSITTSALADGVHAVKATATDAAGNTSADSGSLSVTIDTAAPAAPSTPDLAASSDTGSSSTDNVTADNTPTFTGTAESGSTVKLYVDGLLEGSDTATGGTYSITTSALADGVHAVKATATDAAGNTSADSGSLSVTIDTAAPTATIDLQADSDSGSSSTDNLTNASTLVFDVTFSESVSGLAAGDFTNQGTATGCVIAVGAPTGNVYPVTLTSCSEGTVILRLAASGVTDTAGNANAQTDGPTVTIDRSAPAAPSTPDLAASSDTGSSSTDNVTADNTPTFTGTAESGSTVKLYVDGLLEGSDTATGGTYSITTSALADGVHAVKATATDAAGNTSADSGSLSVTIDTAAPASLITFPLNGSTYTAFSWNAGCLTSFTGDVCGTASDLGGLDDIQVALRITGGNYWTGTGSSFSSAVPVWQTATGTSLWSLLIPYSTFPTAGSYTLEVRAIDLAGNQQTPVSSTFSILNPGGPYTFEGFFNPVNNPPVLNQATAGRAIPVKWRITKDGVAISDPNSFVSLTSRQVACGTLDTIGTDAVETYVGSSGLTYHNDGNWQFNWSTLKSYAGQCRIMTVTLNDGSTHDAYFQFK